MNKYLSYLGDYYALWNMHRKKSKECQFHCDSDQPLSVDKLNTYYLSPQIPNILFTKTGENSKYEIGKFHYPSEVDNNPCNINVIGDYYKNKQGSSANVIIVHGWRTDTLKITSDIFFNKFFDKGYNVFMIYLPFHFERNISECYNGEYMMTANVDRTLLSIKQAVSDIRALIGYLKQNQSNKTYLAGVSLGGFITNMVSVVEKRFDGLISVFPANSIAYIVWNTLTGIYVKKDFTTHDFSYEQLEKYWAIMKPGNFRPRIDKDNILLITAKYDQYIPHSDSDALWQAWGKPKRLLYKCGHSGLVLLKEKIGLDTVGFIDNLIKSKP